jgi:DNA transformation protein
VQAAGHRPSLNLLWALEGALTNAPWREVARLERTRLLLELDDLKTLSKQPHAWVGFRGTK